MGEVERKGVVDAELVESEIWWICGKNRYR